MKKIIVLSLFLLLCMGSTTAQSQIVGMVKVTSPGLEVRRSATESWVPIAVETLVSTGDFIRTLEGGQAELEMFNRSAIIQIHSNTQIIVNRMETIDEGFGVSLGLLMGSTRQSLIPMADTYVAYEFVTPTTRVVTAGGIFDLWVDEELQTSVLTEDGLVYVGADRVELGPSQGIRADGVGLLGSVIEADSKESMSISLDGIPAQLVSSGDIQLNVRQGPNLGTEIMETMFPADVERFTGISEDGEWYRVKIDRRFGWISGTALNITVDTEFLQVYPGDHLESLVEEAPPEAAPVAAVPSGSGILEDFTMAELELIALLNEMRLANGLSPFRPNTTLKAMAYYQGNYILSLPQFPDDVHRDGQGRYPMERALDPQFDWPHYVSAANVSIGENTWVGASAEKAMEYWRNSTVHNQAQTSPAYREVGVAVLPHPWGNLFIVVFGSRPNVLPVLLEPSSGTLYITTEQYQYSSPGDWLISANAYQVLPSALSQIEDASWSSWSQTVSAPTTGEFAVAYQGDEEKLVVTQFDPNRDIVWLPDNLPSEGGEVAGQEPVLAVPAMNTEPTPDPGSGGIFATNTPVPQAGG